ncbi:MAG: protein-L-isoaspartate O-methyltransferase [Patescibacteria group bacterium]
MTKEKLIKGLIKDGYLKTPAIIEAFEKIDRADFVRDENKSDAYANYPLPIGEGQTISQPLTVAFMLELLEPKTGEKILDVGCGSGYQTALLAEIVGDPATAGGKIIGVERIESLKNFAEANLSKYNFLSTIRANGSVSDSRNNNQTGEMVGTITEESKGKSRVKVILGDGSKGFSEEAPYDKIIAAAAGKEIPIAWKEQLKIGGRIVAPVGESIILLTKESQDKFIQKQYFGFSFVPLVINSNGT